MSLLTQLKTAGQTPPVIVLTTGVCLYGAAWSSASLIRHEVEAWSNRHAAPFQSPIEMTPQPPIVRETPRSPSTVNVSANHEKRQEQIGDQHQRAPAPPPTIVARPQSPDLGVMLPGFVAVPPLVGAEPGRFVHPLPHPRPWHPHLPIHRLPDEEWRRELPQFGFGTHRHLGGDLGFIGREDGLLPHVDGGFPFMPRPMPGGIFRPRLPFAGFGHRFF